MALTNINLNLPMPPGSFLGNKLYSSNTAISQQQFLKLLSNPSSTKSSTPSPTKPSKPSSTKPSPKKLRRSRRIQNKQKATNSQSNMDINEDSWMCKCCGQLDNYNDTLDCNMKVDWEDVHINQTESNCTRCKSPQIDSKPNPYINNENIVQGYCRVVIDVPAVVQQLIQNYLTFQKVSFTYSMQIKTYNYIT